MSINEAKDLWKAKSAEWMTPKEVADTYPIGLSTLAKWRIEKKGPVYIRIGKFKILYRPEDIEAFLKSGRVENTPPSVA